MISKNKLIQEFESKHYEISIQVKQKLYDLTGNELASKLKAMAAMQAIYTWE